MWPNPQFPVDLVTFTEYILNGKLHLFCSENFYKHLFYRTPPDDYQKQPFVDVLQTRCSCPEVFCKKGGCRNFAKFIGKQLYQSLLFNKLQAWQACNFIKTEIWHRCFPVYFAKFLRTTFLRTPLGNWTYSRAILFVIEHLLCLSASVYSIYSFGKLVFRLFVFRVFSLFCFELDVIFKVHLHYNFLTIFLIIGKFHVNAV